MSTSHLWWTRTNGRDLWKQQRRRRSTILDDDAESSNSPYLTLPYLTLPSGQVVSRLPTAKTIFQQLTPRDDFYANTEHVHDNVTLVASSLVRKISDITFWSLPPCWPSSCRTCRSKIHRKGWSLIFRRLLHIVVKLPPSRFAGIMFLLSLLCVSVCLSAGYLKKLSTIFDELFLCD